MCIGIARKLAIKYVAAPAVVSAAFTGVTHLERNLDANMQFIELKVERCILVAYTTRQV
jgi:hypothetical protein